MGRSCKSQGYVYFHSKVKIFVQSLFLSCTDSNVSGTIDVQKLWLQKREPANCENSDYWKQLFIPSSGNFGVWSQSYRMAPCCFGNSSVLYKRQQTFRCLFLHHLYMSCTYPPYINRAQGHGNPENVTNLTYQSSNVHHPITGEIVFSEQ